MGEPNRIFIAHAKEDKQQVLKLYKELKARGLHPWLDAKDLIPGQIFETEIRKAIRKAKGFLACFSKNYEKSGYKHKELRLALDTYAEMPPGAIWFIPVRLDDCMLPELEIPALKLSIKEFQWVDLWEEGGLDRLLVAIKSSLGEPVDGKAQTLRDRDAPWCPELVVIPPGRFLMGWPTDGKDQGPQHEVKITYSLAVGRYPVTFAESDAFMMARGTDDRRPKDWNWGRGRRPVIDVSWDQAQTYVTWLSAQTEKHYRLLSEAEWEYACRAGTTTRYSCGDEITEDKANFGCKHGRTTEVGMYPANAFGLHDMHGNVNEWVEDSWHDNYNDAPNDGTAWKGGNLDRRVLRGGSWFDHPWWLRSAARYWRSPSSRTEKLGFRVCREA